MSNSFDEFKNSRAEAEMKAAGEKIMKEAKEREMASKPKPLPMGTKVKYNYQDVSGEGEIVGISQELVVVEFIYIIKTEGVISDVYPYTTFVCPSVYLEVK
jgi:hypothetical protein